MRGQRGRRTAVQGARIPRAKPQLSGDITIAIAYKHGRVSHRSDNLATSRLEPMSENGHNERTEATFMVKSGLAEMLKGGVIMDVVTPEQAKIAEEAGAAAVMALERVPADIRRDGGVARMSDPEMITGIQAAVSIPVMAKARIGHFAEAQVLEALEVDYIDESEVLTPADEANHIDKWAFRIPFVCGATNLGEALRRIGEGAAMIRSKGEAGTGDIVEAVRHLRKIRSELRRLTVMDPEELPTAAKELQAPLPLVRQIAEAGKLPVVLFCAGGIATPADASLVMQLGAEGVFVGSGIFKSDNPERRARAIVEATTHFRDPARVAAASTGLGRAMESLETSKLESEQLLSPRGW
jgi:pyridoxal 5'-phosphate synthase pdxS subunit